MPDKLPDSQSRQTVLVTGASGALGPRVVQALCQAGYVVRALSLDRVAPGIFPDGVEDIEGDVTDPATVDAAMDGISAVVHMAALLHIVNPPAAFRENYERINVGGTATVIKAAIRANVRRVVLFSTIAVYGYGRGQILTEDSIPSPDTLYAQTKLAAEKLVLSARDSDHQPMGTVLRLGAVYGARVKGNYRRLLLSLSRGRFMPVGAGRNRRTLIYDRDVARAAVLAMNHPAAVGQIYNVSDGQFHPLNEIIKTMCTALGRVPPRITLPVIPAQLAVSILEGGARLIGQSPPVSRATLEKYTEDVIVSSQRIQTQLGFVPEFDLTAGWRETVSEMRQTGDL